MPFTNWYAGEPNLQLDENCLIAFRWNDFKWNDLNCALSAPYIYASFDLVLKETT